MSGLLQLHREASHKLISKNFLCGSVYLIAQISACIQAQLTAAIIMYHFKLAFYHNWGMSALNNRHKYV